MTWCWSHKCYKEVKLALLLMFRANCATNSCIYLKAHNAQFRRCLVDIRCGHNISLLSSTLFEFMLYNSFFGFRRKTKNVNFDHAWECWMCVKPPDSHQVVRTVPQYTWFCTAEHFSHWWELNRAGCLPEPSPPKNPKPKTTMCYKSDHSGKYKTHFLFLH